jgi:hypothetical protein
MDAKLKWFERSWNAKAKGKSATPGVSAAEAPSQNEAEAGEVAKPGAVAVPGPGYEGNEDNGVVPTVRIGRGGQAAREVCDDEATDVP